METSHAGPGQPSRSALTAAAARAAHLIVDGQPAIFADALAGARSATARKSSSPITSGAARPPC
jgi:hypothetical protein